MVSCQAQLVEVCQLKQKLEETLRQRERELTALKGALKEEVATHDKEIEALRVQYSADMEKLRSSMEQVSQVHNEFLSWRQHGWTVTSLTGPWEMLVGFWYKNTVSVISLRAVYAQIGFVLRNGQKRHGYCTSLPSVKRGDCDTIVSQFFFWFSLMQELRQSGCVSMHPFAPYSSSWRTVGMRAATGWSSFIPPEMNFVRLNKSEFIQRITVFIYQNWKCGISVVAWVYFEPTNLCSYVFFRCFASFCQRATRQPWDSVSVTNWAFMFRCRFVV